MESAIRGGDGPGASRPRTAVDTTAACLRIMTDVVARIAIDREACAAAMTPELYATEDAYRLVEQGVPFRDAYRRIAERYVDP